MAEISEVMLFCEKYYSKKKFLHALRVAAFALDKAEHDDRVDSKDAFIVGLCHDLIEDTDCSQDQLQMLIGIDLFSSVCILTKSDTESYQDYIIDVIYSNDPLAILVNPLTDLKNRPVNVQPLRQKILNFRNPAGNQEVTGRHLPLCFLPILAPF